jgi:hypothetical protein
MEKASLSERSSKRIWFYILLIIIAGLLVVLISNEIKQNKEDAIRIQYIEEKNSLRDDLDDLIDEHDELLDEYGDLNNLLQDTDSIIQNQIIEIRDLIRTKDDLSEARNKIAILKEISKRYLSNIDSLFLINENLTFEKDSVIKENKNINWKNYKLSKQNEKLAEKVSKGSVLEVLDINIECLRYRRTGKEVTTRSAKKTQKVRVCFTIGANQLSDAEEKIVFMQLMNPNGELIESKENITVHVSDSIFNCTNFFSFHYKNLQMNSCFEWQREQQLKGGDYLINLIIEGRIAAQKNFQLR